MLGQEIKCQQCSQLTVLNLPANESNQANLSSASQQPLFNSSAKPLSVPKAPSKKINLVTPMVILVLIVFGYLGYKEFEKINNDSTTPAGESVITEVKIVEPDSIKEGIAKIEPEPEPVKKIDTGAILKPEVIANVDAARNEKGNLLISNFKDVVEPFAKKHCITCHGPEDDEGDFRMDKLMNTGLIRSEADAEYWQEVLDILNVGEMPPVEEEQPTRDEMTAMLDALYQTTANARDIIASKGTGVMRRMNSREYTNTIQDLLGLTVPANTLPQDRGAFGFDTLGADLNTTPAELQGYIDVGHTLMSKVTADYAFGREVPEKMLSIFGDISRTPKDSEAEELFKRFVIRLYSHQPVSIKMVKDMTAIFKFNRRKSTPFWEATSIAFTCALASPNLIFVVEKDVELDQLDIANRLSLLLWSSVPDLELIKLARDGKLTNPEIYSAQFDRMVQDPKADRFFNTFIHQWLELERLEVVNFDGEIYPKLKEKEAELKEDMTKETLAFMRHLIRKNKPSREIVSADFTMLNTRLAKHYGVKNFNEKKGEFSKVILKGKNKVRGGLLGQGSVQMLTSNGARTSPVERGVYILRKILDSSPPPAPADVPEAEDVTGENQTTRDLLKHHMTTAQCATCHLKIDPLGFGMESFGPLGRWRTHEGKLPIDASGQMTNGKKFDDYQGLLANLAVNDERIARGFVKAVMAYAIGRQIRYTDSGEVTKIIELSRDNDFKLKDLIFQVTKSDVFQTKQ